MGFLKVSCKAGHWGKAELEKKEKKIKEAKKRKKSKEEKKRAREEVEKKIEELAFTKVENLSKEDKQKLKQRYEHLKNTKDISFEDRADKIFAENHNFKEFLVKHFKSQAEELI